MPGKKDFEIAEKLARMAQESGGRAYYVGGCVRDKLLGRPGADLDMEIYGIPAGQLEAMLDSLGSRTGAGEIFGIYSLKEYELDIALPRTEVLTGAGHREFRITPDPDLDTKTACRRRDFTINAMLEDVLTGEIIDHFHGREDLEKGLIRHIDSRFHEDPLRVLRAASFAARFHYQVAEETREICRTMPLDTLTGERVHREMMQALMKAEKPSIFFEELRKMGQLDVWFPELARLIGSEQSPEHHPEGDVWVHTMMVVDQAASLREQAIFAEPFMLSALCHDFGKPDCFEVKDGKIHSYGHEKAGCMAARAFLRRLEVRKEHIRYAENMIYLHMRPNILVRQQARNQSYARLFDQCLCPDDLLLLSKADYTGRGGDVAYDFYEKALRDHLTAFRNLLSKPYVTGEDLIQEGLKPGKDFKELLAYAHKLRLSGVSRQTALKQVRSYAHEHGMI